MYFDNCKNLEELKSLYKELAKKFHPDMGGSEEIMKQINNEYDVYFMKLQNKSNNNYDKEESINNFKDIINKIIKFDFDIEICGTWIWIDKRNTYPHRALLKELGFIWSKAKGKWYKKPDDYIARRHKTWTMEQIREIYGSQKIQKEKEELAYIAG